MIRMLKHFINRSGFFAIGNRRKKWKKMLVSFFFSFFFFVKDLLFKRRNNKTFFFPFKSTLKTIFYLENNGRGETKM